MKPSRCARKIDWQIRIKLSDCFTQRWSKRFCALSGARPNDDCAKLRRWLGSEQRHVEACVVGLLVERPLHQRVRHHADDSAPRLGLAGIENPDLMTKGALIAPMLARKTRVHDRDRVFRIRVVDSEIAAFKDFQPERAEIIVRDRLVISARSVTINQIILSVHFVLAAAGEGHLKAIA